MQVTSVKLPKKLQQSLMKRGLLAQFDKAIQYILSGDYLSADFKLRHPKHQNIRYFRVNRQFRCKARIDNGCLTIFEIDNHQ